MISIRGKINWCLGFESNTMFKKVVLLLFLAAGVLGFEDNPLSHGRLIFFIKVF